jgi:hypothetical protein
VRKVLTILMLVASVLWQGLSTVHASVDIEAAVHAASHAGPAHHHEDDGSTHFDDSEESLQHMQADQAGTVNAALPDAPAVALPSFRHARNRASTGSPPPDPFLAGLDRPPRHFS